jgi:large subunit ribosomal protein L24
MKKEWSRKWAASKQPRKQRKFRINAPVHTRRKFISAHLSPVLRKRYNRRSMGVRKGDEVMVMTGSMKGKKGLVERVDLKKSKVYIDNIKIKKSDGSEIMRAIEPSNIMITVMKVDDKKRGKALERSARKEAVSKPAKEKTA